MGFFGGRFASLDRRLLRCPFPRPPAPSPPQPQARDAKSEEKKSETPPKKKPPPPKPKKEVAKTTKLVRATIPEGLRDVRRVVVVGDGA